ncbi:MAG: GGDEF domain-containing protein [Acidimicrobiales bacterium]
MTADDLSLIAQVEALRAELDRERHLARHDPLTGALNRRGGLEAIASLSPPFAIALVDLDHFRRVNRLPGRCASTRPGSPINGSG